MGTQTSLRGGQPESNSTSPLAEKPALRQVPVPTSVGASKAAPLQDVLFGKPDLSTGLVIRNLLNDLDDLTALLITAVHESDWLNAFLFAAGVAQVAEDYVHSDPLYLQRAEKVFEGLHHPLVRIPRASVRLARNIETSLFGLNQGYRRAQSWTNRWKQLVQGLAEAAVSACSEEPLPEERRADLTRQSLTLLDEIEHLPPRLRRSILRLPNCFRSFDQRPEDLRRLAAKFAQQYPDRKQPVVVVGLRTSGSYLAPLLRTFLHRQGYVDVSFITLRPGVDLLGFEKAQIHQANQRQALFAVVDDPPVTGQSLLKAARELERLRVSPGSIVLMLPLFEGSDSRHLKRLETYPKIVLPWAEWAIHDLASPEAVQKALSGWLLPGLQVTGVEPVTASIDDTERGHVTRLYSVTIREPGNVRKWRKEIFVKGVGLGYLGEQVQDALQHLSRHLPTIYGLRDGLLFRAWIPQENQLGHVDELDASAAARDMVAYVWDRHLQLPVPEDTGLRRFGDSPAWEVASNLISHVFGRAWKFVRVPLVDPIMRRLMRSTSPSIVDGNMALSNWFFLPRRNSVKKVAFERSVFRNGAEYTSYDPVFDLASLATDLDMAALKGNEWAKEVFSSIRSGYERLSGEKIDEERWLLYQLVRLLDLQRARPASQKHILRRAYARAFQRYFSARYFQNLPTNPRGEICAFDLDGVLETNYLRGPLSLSFPALSPASATSLRALAQHGYRSILTTGRSLPEVIERCQLYPVAGGVAEYGAAFYSRAKGTVRVLLSDVEQQALADLRKYLQMQDSIIIDPDYQYAVRASCVDAQGRRAGLSKDQIASALRSCASSSARIRAIPGEEQTDFMVERIDKAVGARELLKELLEASGDGMHADPKPLALAVGDSVSDLPVLRMAKRAAVPAHASPQLNQPGIHRRRQAYQAGLAKAVTDLTGHSTRQCRECQPLLLSEDASRLLALFAAQEDGNKSILTSLISLICS